MSLQKEILIRYRDEEHVRFELPKALCEDALSARLVAGLRGIEGVYRVDLFPRQRKLSVRFMSTVLEFSSLARALDAIVDELARAAEPSARPDSHPLARTQAGLRGLRDTKPARWIREKYQELRETVTAAGILVKAGKRKPAAFLPSSNLAIDFFTDILVLYLVKIHWNTIFNVWLRRPWQYKSEWMATFYMIFLLVRSRMPKTQ